MPSGPVPPTVPPVSPPTSEPSHTPGEWIVSCREQDEEIHDENRFYIRLQPYPDGHVGKLIGTVNKHLEGGEANARLIAAAPDLLAACKEALQALGECGCDDNEMGKEAMDTLSAAIAKAGGVA